MIQSPPISAPAVIDTVAKVFRDPAYNESAAPSLLDRLLHWLGGIFSKLLDMAASHPAAGAVVRWGVYIIVALILIRVIYALALRYREINHLPRLPASVRGKDPWLAAQQLAAEGNYTDAAHALYLAMLVAAAHRGQITLHDSKTVGDYTRELRPKATKETYSRFANFARSYEVVVYGIGSCDEERYHTLRELASPLVVPAAA